MKKYIALIPIIVAILGLIGTVVAAFFSIIPSLLENKNNAATEEDTSKVVYYVKYDDPSSCLSIEYPSDYGLESREVINSKYIEIIIEPRNKIPILAGEGYITKGGSFRLLMNCGISNGNISNEMFLELINKAFSEKDKKRPILVTNNTIENGFFIQYEGKGVGETTQYVYYYEYIEGAEIIINLQIDGDYESTYEVVSHIIESLEWSPLKTVEYFN